MWQARGGLLLLLLVAAQGAETRVKVTPVEKVITLLNKIRAEIMEEGKAEAVGYDKFACFCKEQADQKLYAISKSEEKIALLDSKIKKLDSEINELNAEIVDTKKKKADLEKEQKEEAGKRAKAHEEYAGNEQDMAKAIDAIERAIEALKTSKDGMTDAKLAMASVSQRASRRNSAVEDTVRMVTSLLEQAPAAYEYQSNDIIATLQGLLKTFKADKYDLDTSEADAKNSHEMEAGARANKIRTMDNLIQDNAEMSADKMNEKSATQLDLEDESKMKKQDASFMDELTSSCEEKAKQWDQRSKTRAAEITAITEAVKTLETGVAPNYSANKKLTLVSEHRIASTVSRHDDDGDSDQNDADESSDADDAQGADEGKGETEEESDENDDAEDVSFIQLRGGRKPHMVVNSKKARGAVLKYLSQRAKTLKSTRLSAIVSKLKMGKDHFKKVRELIKDLIAKLKEQAEAEATQKSWCDEEMGKAVEGRDESVGKIEDSTASIDGSESKIANLKEDIEILYKEIAELFKALNELQELRKQEKAQNEKTISDAEAGKEAVEQAIKVLKEFYDNAFFIQGKFEPAGGDRSGNTVEDLAPDAGFDDEYGGKQEQAKGIFGLLEVILSDFEGTIEATKKAEEDAQKKFEKEEEEIKTDMEDKKTTRKDKQKELEEEEANLIGYKQDLKDAKESLADSKEELSKLKPMCIDTGMSWKARREQMLQEIDALKQALAILEDWKK